ncbi:MAG TPA: VWA domain-containing protein, partial [Terriglobia bacterium]|nr:VWA domain-containing protein [Terriglobia bacterium]
MKRRLIVTVMLGLTAVGFLSSSVQAQSTQAANTSSAAVVPVSPNLTVSSGEKLVLQLDTPLHTRSIRDGDRAYFRTSDEVMAGGMVAIPRGSEVRATVTHVRRPGRLAGRAEIRLRFDDVRLPDGTILPLQASVVRAGHTDIKTSKEGDQALKGDGGNGSSLTIVGQGGMQGAILGASIGGGKGAIYGGAAGAAVGLATVMLQRGPDLDLPRDMLFELKFDQAFQVPAAVAQRAVQIARSVPVAPPVNSTGNYPVPVDTFPSDPGAAPVPDFSKDNEQGAPPVETGTVDVATAGRTTPPVILPPAGTSGNSQPTVEDTSGADDFKLKVDVQLVMVDATVRDRSGRPMETLRREDFRVFENGLEQTIQAFSRDEYPLAVALVVDRSGSVAPYMNELRQAAYRALHQLKRGDQVCLFTFAGEVQRLEDLTTDRQRIANRI